MLTNIPYIFTKASIIEKFGNVQQYNNWIKTKIKNSKIKKVRNGLYVSTDSMGNISSTKFEIASKISDSSFIAYHSALEYYGIANQVFNDMIVGNDARFNYFEFDGIGYTCEVVQNYEQVNYMVNEQIRVSSLERTIIDCIDNIELAGGIEEVLNALEQTKVLNENKLVDVLKSYNKILLYQKVGFLLEEYKEQLALSSKFFEECLKKLTKQIKYFLKDEYKELKYNAKWKLMAPTNIKARINGGF